MRASASDNGCMDTAEARDQPAEDMSMNAVVDRIATRFPDIDGARIDALVSEAAHRLDGARVRDFIPVLVEHEVMDALRAEADPVPVAELGLESTLVDDPRPGDPTRSDPYEVEGESGRSGPLLGGLSNN